MTLPKDFRWKQIRELGAGGQATVFEVEDAAKILPGKYALKPLKTGASHQAYERFYREIGAVEALHHPYIIRIIERSKPEDDFHYYVMEFINGARTLKSLLNTKGNPFHREALKALRLFMQLVEVVEATQKAGIVHRDLSPANVLILPDNSIKVIDLGICQIEGDTTITLVDEGLGTRNYAPPECESGVGGSISF